MKEIDWENLGFAYQPTKSNIRFHYANGQWSEGKLYNTYDINISVCANVLHYGQAAFEGLKAFRCKDGKIRIFRPDENGMRLNSSCRRLLMPEFPVDKFVEAVKTVVADNEEYIPPYGTGGSLYIRPVIFGTTPQIGVNPSEEYELVIMVVPVGAYYKGGIKPVDALIARDFDRAAPHGTGNVKAAGNYAASLYSSKYAKERHCPVALFLDPSTRTYIDEFGTSNFLAITKDGKYVTSKSDSILPSITNKSLMTIAEDLGMTVERRPVKVEELADFAEVAACGTAVVITPVGRIFDGDTVYDYNITEIGPNMRKLYDAMTGIQYGELPDTHNWTVEI
jgi:branched-chain amino acid aminotransferase